jgi:hypothetical protein
MMVLHMPCPGPPGAGLSDSIMMPASAAHLEHQQEDWAGPSLVKLTALH